MPVATLSDVEASLGRSISEGREEIQVTTWLADAEMLVRSRLGDVTKLDQENLRYVEREAVIARMRNPDGFQSETIDDYTFRYGSSSQQVTILDEWWQLLSPATDQPTGSTRPGFDVDTVRWPGNNDLDRRSGGYWWFSA